MVELKSSHHKEGNRYKFESFSDRLASINVDVCRRLPHPNDVLDEEEDSYFVAGLEKWRDLNCTQDFVNFSREVSRNIRNYKQLVHYEEECMSLLKKHLQVKPSLAYLPLLDLVVQLARDLQQDMYPHFKDFFLIIVGLLDTQDTELLEGAFQTLGYLFKFLWRYLVKNVESVYELYSSLLVASKTEHILRFAAESFAFLLRKVKSQDNFFDFILNDVSDTPEKVAGVGRLFFEMLRGVRRQLHSCAPRVLHSLLSKLRPQKSKGSKKDCVISCDVVHDCLQAMLQCICKYVNEETATLVWQCLLDAAVSVTGELEGVSNKKMRDELSQHLMYIIKLVKTLVRHGHGKLVSNPKQLYQCELTLLTNSSLPETCSQDVLDLLTTSLLCKHSFLNMEQTASLINCVFSTQYTNRQVLSFCQKVTNMHDFEVMLLPKLLEFVHGQMLSDKTSSQFKELILFTLVELIKNKSPTSHLSEVMTSCEKYCLDFSILVEKVKIASKKRGRKSAGVQMGETFADFLLTLVEKYLVGEEDVNKLYGALICLPSVRPLNNTKCRSLLMKLITNLEVSVKNTVEKEEAVLYLYLLSCCVQAYCHCSEAADVKDLENIILKLLRFYSASEYVLLAAECLFSKLVSASIPLNVEGMLSVFSLLQDNLTSYSSKVRLLTLRILVHLPVTLPEFHDSPGDQCSVLQLCLNAEEVPLTLETYREKLMHLRKLEYNTVTSNLPVDWDMSEVALRYLISMLHVNLQLLWEPVIDLIKSHALGMDAAKFWSVYHPILKLAAEAISKLEPCDDKRHSTNLTQLSKAESLEESLGNSLKMMCQTADRPDLINFRNLLWKAMVLFPEKVEIKTRDLVPMILQFVENEYNIAEAVLAPSQDITKKSTKIDEDEQEEEEEDVAVTGQTKSFHSKASLQKSLVIHLQLFSKFRNPKSAFQEAKMRDLFFCLLSSPHAAVQKVALDCVMTYKFKYLLPYSEQFTALMNDKTFTEALLLFNLDEESGLIEEHHRAGLLPVLFRILYGKMLSRSGAGPQGKSGLGFRRSLILRFLGGSKEAEMKIFLDLVFEPVLRNVEEDCMLKASLDALSPSKVVPLKKQHSILESCSVLLSRVGHLVGSYNSTILRILITVTGSYNALLDKRDELVPHAVKQLKTLRQRAVNCLEQFFDIYDQYPFTSDEIDSLFEAVVWPQLEKLSSEGLAGPTPLLKLFCGWSKRPRFHILLAKHHPTNRSLYAIPSCITLLSSTLAAPPVVAMVMEIIYNLLNIEDEEEENDTSLRIEDVIAMSKVKVAGKEVQVSTGVNLIQPHVSAILSYLRNAVKPRKVNSELPLKEISLLSKLSGYIDDPTLSSNLISLLLPHLEKTKEKHENIEVDILNTIKNLVVFVDDSHQFHNKLSKCLQRLTSRNSRTVLCDVISAMATKVVSMEEAGRYVQDLNAWDKKRLDEPDYTRRLAAFKQLNQKVTKMAGDINTVFYSLMLDNCFYFVLRMDEMSMRDSSSFFLICFIEKISGMKDSKTTAENLILSKYLPALKEGVKARKESVRHECISILSEVVKYFPSLEVFKTLTVLHNADKEKDFYENIRHIQIHRRVRALRKLSKHCKEGQLEVKGVRHFLLPIVTALIFDPDLVSKHENVVLDAVECVGAIARLMPWGTYFALLKQFLRLLLKNLEQQKIAVRLLVVVLEAFHFDLSSSEYVYQEEPAVLEDKGIPGAEGSGDKEEEKEETGDNGADEETIEDEGPSVVGNEKALATKIHRTIVNSILPKLLEILTERTRQDGLHKSLRDNTADDSEILRVPLAVAMVKLVKRLPNDALEKHLPRIVLKVCNILKHRVMNVRDIARDSLIKILATVGVEHFDSILHQMSGCLTRGYQVHVLGYSLYALVKSIPNLNTGDLDKSMDKVVKILNEELFGEISEEKEVAAIISKLPEAKGTKSFDCYELIGKVIGEGSLTALILPLKEMLDTTHSHKVVNKVREVLRRVSLGLSSNKGLKVESMMIFVHGLASDTLPLVTPFEKTKAAVAAPRDPRLPPPSVYLLPPKPKRWGESANTGRKTNMHVLMEFGLLLLQNSLKSSKLVPNNQFHLSMLDPFIDILSKALAAKANVVISVAIRCLTRILRFPLPSLQTSIEEITKSVFQLLKRHAGAGVSKGENLELVTNTFKAVTVLVRDCKHHKINEKQLQVLLAYCEEDIYDYTRQTTAFPLLSAILSRKLLVPEIHGVMEKVRQLAITSETGFIRQQCRQVDLRYLLDYPLGKKIKAPLEFYVSQLSYEMESGRKSALDMLTTIFNTFPQQLLQAYAGLFFVPLAISLVNDESTSCRRLTASALKVLLSKLDVKKRNDLFVMVKQWLEDEEAAHQRLAVQLCGIFVAADDFQPKLEFLLKVLEEKLRPENCNMSEDDASNEEDDQDIDHLLFHLLSCLLKVLKTCSIIKSDQHEPILNKIWNSVEEHLLHPHAWIRITTAQLYGELFAAWPHQILVPALEAVETKSKQKETLVNCSNAYIVVNGRSKIKVLITKFCGQLLSSDLKKEHCNQIVKNLVYLGKVMHRVYPMNKAEVERIGNVMGDEVIIGSNVISRSVVERTDDEMSGEEEGSQDLEDDQLDEGKNMLGDEEDKLGGALSILWLVRKLCWICANEVIRTPKETVKRTSVIKWFAALTLDMKPDDVKVCLRPMIKVLAREIDDHSRHKDDSLKVLCQEVLELLKSTVGLEYFTQTYTDVQRDRQELKLWRKRQRALEAVADPEEAAKRKMKKNLLKKEAKKRKLQRRRPTYMLAKKMKTAPE